jgi:lantibiotic modifying enzyme
MIRERLEKAYNDLRKFLNEADSKKYAKLCAILDAEKYGRKWIDIEVRCGKAKERFPKHYKSYVEMVEYITGRNYRRYKFDLK